MGKIELTSLQKRILTSLVMIPFVIGTLYLGHPYIDILVFMVGAMLSWEWSSMVPGKRANVYSVFYTFAVGCALMILDLVILLPLLVLLSLIIYLKAKDEKHRKLITLGVPYVSVGVGSLYWIYYLFEASITTENSSFIMTLWFILMVWSVDTGGYVVGSTIKGPKLAPKISPNKTWSGLIGGVILAVAVSFIFMYVTKTVLNLQLSLSAQLVYAQLAALIAIIAQIGDLCESAIKRHLGVKDSSNLIPGHGGVFDRIDGLIFSAPFVYCIFSFIF